MKMNEKRHMRAYPALVRPAMALVTIRLAKPEEGIRCLAPAECHLEANPTGLPDAEVIRLAKVALQPLERNIRVDSGHRMSLVDVTFSVGIVKGELRVIDKDTRKRVLDGLDFEKGRILDRQGDIDARLGFYKTKLKPKVKTEAA